MASQKIRPERCSEQSRGRGGSAASRHLATSESSRRNNAAPSSLKQDPTVASASTLVDSQTKVKVHNAAGAKSGPVTARSHPEIQSRPKANKASETASSSSATLSLAAQIQSWRYMTSSLETCHQSAEQEAITELELRSEDLSVEEEGMADTRARFEAQRLLAFYDELNEEICRDVPALVRDFLRHEQACEEALLEAPRLSNLSRKDGLHLKQCDEILDTLDVLEREVLRIQSVTIDMLSDQHRKPNSKMSTILQGLLPVIRARHANIQSARLLVLTDKSNARLGLQTDSLRLHP